MAFSPNARFRSPPVTALAALLAFAAGCGTITLPEETKSGPTNADETLLPGEVCPELTPAQIQVRTEPSRVFVTPCGDASCPGRSVNVIVEPDHCVRTPVSLSIADSALAEYVVTDPKVVDVTTPDAVLVPGPSVGIHQPIIPLAIRGLAVGSTELVVRFPKGDGTNVEARVAIEILDPAIPTCDGAPPATGMLKGGSSVEGAGGLAGATIKLPKGADAPNTGSFLWSVEPFDATVACAATDVVPQGFAKLGPAVTFGPEDKVFRREVPLSIPLNPAVMPGPARWRHLRVAYSGPGFKEPRTIPVADPRIDKVGDAWALTFKAPRLGTYQAVVKPDAGTNTRQRRLTHRAVIGVSMGGGGAAMFGFRHHDLFDVIAPLGGPVDWTWLLDYIAENHLGGFRPVPPGATLADIQLQSTPCATSAACLPDETCLGASTNPPTLGACVLMPAANDPYEHPQTFNHWWIEYPRNGTGGQFARDEYAQIFRDLALMFGNPNGDNLAPGGENLPSGVPPTDKSVVGDHPNGECSVWIDPLNCSDGADTCEEKTKQQEIAEHCPAERCAHTLRLDGYYDDEYNPDGLFPVITVCDGSPQIEALSPYANTWRPEGNNAPLEVGLAVDYNQNGVRDELEPIIRAGHERWDDYGPDDLPSSTEPGYAKGKNDDPAGDDYQAQYNPGGTEGDHRREAEETFYDTGLDGVFGTKQQPADGWKVPGDGYDVGESDGQFTVSRGLQRFWDYDPRSVVLRTAPSVPGGELDDEALSRIDVWTDGGLRDLFNFHVDAQHMVGGLFTRGRDATYLTDFTEAPGLDPLQPNTQEPERIVFEDLQGVVLQRYGKLDPTPKDIEDGSGQHVGTVGEIASRLQNALYFIGSRWPEPELRTLAAENADKPAKGASECEIIGNCTIEFTSSDGRVGPVGITLPPGYAHADQQTRRYPVIYMLHGYGMSPEELEAAIVFLTNWMNGTTKSMASRLPKAILVYVDGRCRIGPTGKAECIRGTFFTDSVRAEGAHDEKWWLELIDYVDQNYRTMGESSTDWTE